jgi:DNA-binding response OmpR family regulator
MELLLVQDGDDFRDTVARWMVRHGHRVAEGASGQEGLALITQRQFDVAIFVANLPDLSGLDLSGLDLLQEIKRRADEIEIIMLTGEDAHG